MHHSRILNRPACPAWLFAGFITLLAAASGMAADTVNGNLLLQVKGELNVYHNGRKISLRDKADADQHFRVKVPEKTFAAGDVIVLHVHSPYVYRAISAAIDLEKKGGQIPVKKQHWRIITKPVDPRKITATMLQASLENPDLAKPDGNGETERAKLGMISADANGSDWVKTPRQLNSWYCIGFVLTPEMLATKLPVK